MQFIVQDVFEEVVDLYLFSLRGLLEVRHLDDCNALFSLAMLRSRLRMSAALLHVIVNECFFIKYRVIS